MLSQNHQQAATLDNQGLQANQYPVLNPNLHQQLNLLGIGFLILAVATSIILYSSFASTGLEKFFYSLMGFLLCLSTCVALKTAYTLWLNQNNPLAAFMLILYFCLFIIEWSTVTGFTSKAQSDTTTNSKAAVLVKEQLKLSTDRLESLAQYRSLSPVEIDSKRANIETEVRKLETRLNACNPAYITKCIRPLEQQISAKKEALAALSVEFKNATSYALAASEKAQYLQLSLDGSQVASYHPLFETLAKLSGEHPANVQAKFLAFSALITTILTSFLFLIASVLKQRFVLVPAQSTNLKQQGLQSNQQSNISLFEALRNNLIQKLNTAKKP